MDSAMNTALGRGSAMSANVRAMKDALMPVRLHRANSLRIAWEGWEIEIFGDDEYMYVLEREFEYPTTESGYQRWFKVRKDHYLAEWQSAIEASHEIVYLENAEYNEWKNKREN
jgi:hypothetical protein